MAHKHIHSTKLLPDSEVTNYKALCGGLAWAAINTRPDIGFDTSWLASKGPTANGSDVAFGNKIQRRLKTTPSDLKFFKISTDLKDWSFVAFHDAGFATRPSLHSQTGALIFVADKKVQDGKQANCMLVDWLCSRIDRVVRSSFEAEINSAQSTLDQLEFVHAMLTLILKGCTLKEYREMKDREEANLVGDNKGVYTAVQACNPITTKGEKRLTIDKMLMKDHLRDFRVKYMWTNAGHQLADALTKLSTAGARLDLLLAVIEQGVLRITYSEVSGRREAKENYQKKKQQVTTQEEEADQMFALDQNDSPEDRIPQDQEADSWDKYHYDL